MKPDTHCPATAPERPGPGQPVREPGRGAVAGVRDTAKPFTSHNGQSVNPRPIETPTALSTAGTGTDHRRREKKVRRVAAGPLISANKGQPGSAVFPSADPNTPAAPLPSTS